MNFEEKLKELNIDLPKATAPVGSYVATKEVGKFLFISGQISIDKDGNLIKGKLGKNFSVEEGYEAAKANLNSPIEITTAHLAAGKELYGVYCAVCHGKKGDGQGILMTREKFLGIPSYADREINQGSIYHVLMYGKNAMGSHAGQVNEIERWQIAQHVMELRGKLLK